jgi:hypothetical protein
VALEGLEHALAQRGAIEDVGAHHARPRAGVAGNRAGPSRPGEPRQIERSSHDRHFSGTNSQAWEMRLP